MGRVSKEDTQCCPLSFTCLHTCVHTHACTYITHTRTHTHITNFPRFITKHLV